MDSKTNWALERQRSNLILGVSIDYQPDKSQLKYLCLSEIHRKPVTVHGEENGHKIVVFGGGF
jgi:hypothetical protein